MVFHFLNKKNVLNRLELICKASVKGRKIKCGCSKLTCKGLKYYTKKCKALLIPSMAEVPKVAL